jgi:uncharacterized small protein (DUF1192 family)
MKTLPRVALALMSLVGPMSMADTRPADARPTDSVESSEVRKAPAEYDRARMGPSVSELEQRVQALESELARVRAQEQDRFQFPGAWNVGTDGP